MNLLQQNSDLQSYICNMLGLMSTLKIETKLESFLKYFQKYHMDMMDLNDQFPNTGYFVNSWAFVSELKRCAVFSEQDYRVLMEPYNGVG